MKHQSKLVCALLFFGAALQPLSVQAGEPAQLPVVSDQASLTVSGEGYWHRQMYQNGDVPTLSSYDSSGQSLPDGAYRYEYRAVASASASSSQQMGLLDGAEQPTGQAKGKSQRPNAISGRFEVQGGEITYR